MYKLTNRLNEQTVDASPRSVGFDGFGCELTVAVQTEAKTERHHDVLIQIDQLISYCIDSIRFDFAHFVTVDFNQMQNELTNANNKMKIKCSFSLFSDGVFYLEIVASAFIPSFLLECVPFQIMTNVFRIFISLSDISFKA